MPQDEASKPKITSISKASKSPWLTTPKTIRRLFDRFPLVTYPANELPKRTPIDHTQHALYIFARKSDVRQIVPSFNPGCLKWQTYLLLTGISFTTIPSTNHASPTGSLPFLIPVSSVSNLESATLETIPPIPSAKLQEWATKDRGTTSRKDPEDMRYEAYMTLLDNRIRSAWLHTLYLSSSNFDAVARPLYIKSATSSSLVHFSLQRALQAAALEEIVKASNAPVVDIGLLYRESDNAFSALSELLGDNEWFLGKEEPGLMDASVFAYTHLLLDETLGWITKEERLGKGLRDGRWTNLVDHRRRIYEKCYS